ncbi:MAG: division/cell wall cluster transcriptional repressor MraZ [Patescibacteria group bacterium]
MMFLGEYEVSFTAPGRIVLPKKLREAIVSNSVVLTKGANECLAGYEPRAWEKITESLMNNPLTDDVNLNRKRFLFSATSYVEIDDQGRFVIPKALLQFATLDNSAVIIGVGDHFEIWNDEKWQSYNLTMGQKL